MRRFLLVLPLVFACSTGGTNSSGAPTANRDVITREEIDQAVASDVYTLVQRMRPEYLRAQRGSSSINAAAQMPVVYIDGVRRGGPDLLRTMRTNDLEEIRFINGRDATTRWGTDHGAGVIDLSTRR